MRPKSILPKPKNLIPFYYMFKGQIEDGEAKKSILRKLPKYTVNAIYSLGLATVLVSYVGNARETGEFNPFKQDEAVNRLAIEQRIEEENYNENFEKLFGFNGYADANRDNIINFKERVEVYRRMGFFQDVLPIAGETEFPKPTLNQLEMAVKSYENK